MTTAPTNEELSHRLRRMADGVGIYDEDALRAAAARLSESGGGQWRAHDNSGMRYPEESDLSGGATDVEAREVVERLRYFATYEEDGSHGLKEALDNAAALVERLSKDAERHRFAMRHVVYYSAQGEFLVDCARNILVGSCASEDYEKWIDKGLAQDAALKERT